MIQAKIVADSLAPTGARLTTLEIVFPRYILAELNTHRLFSKNSASSRAIPFEKMVKQVEENPFIPYAWQKDHKGMQGEDYITNEHLIKEASRLWLKARDNAITSATLLNSSIGGEGVTKQLCNRLLEPFMYHKVLISSTEWENFFNLRCPKYTNKEGEVYRSKKDWCRDYETNVLQPEVDIDSSTLEWLQVNKGQADIHMMFLAEAIYDAMNESTLVELQEGEWHIPYGNNIDIPWACSGQEELEQTLCKISIARCARLSYQTLGDNPVIDYEKDLQLYENLSTSGHWSPFEHVARVMTTDEYFENIKGNNFFQPRENGLGESILHTTLTKEDKRVGWCKNFKGFIQVRELLETKQF